MLSSSFLLKSSFLISLFVTFAAAAPKKVDVPILPFAGLFPQEGSASVAGTDAAGHTTYVLEVGFLEDMETVTTVSGVARTSDVKTSWRETATLVAGKDYVSQTMEFMEDPPFTQTAGYACTFSGASAVCEGYNPQNTQVSSGVVLSSTIPTAAFEKLTLDVNAGLVHGPSMVMASLGLMVSTILFRLLA
ncbi:hypothetical protein C8F01DRAFT_1098779 [Mycena amicta]|nr:hypothetical protein C8F01DRAFT_1098779 [Mycena amicta]